MMDDDEEKMEERKKQLASLNLEQLKTHAASIEPWVAKIAQLQEQTGHIPNTEHRLVKQVGTASVREQKFVTIDDVRKRSWAN